MFPIVENIQPIEFLNFIFCRLTKCCFIKTNQRRHSNHTFTHIMTGTRESSPEINIIKTSPSTSSPRSSFRSPSGLNCDDNHPWREFHPQHDHNQSTHSSDSHKSIKNIQDKTQSNLIAQKTNHLGLNIPRFTMEDSEAEDTFQLLKPLPPRYKCCCFYVRYGTRYLISIISMLLLISIATGLFLLWPRPMNVNMISVTPIEDKLEVYRTNRTIYYMFEASFEIVNPNYITTELHSMGVTANVQGNESTDLGLGTKIWKTPVQFLSNIQPTIMNLQWILEYSGTKSQTSNPEVYRFFQQCFSNNSTTLSFSFWFDYALFHWTGYKSSAKCTDNRLLCGDTLSEYKDVI